jgi:hypothetical protein
VFYYAFNIYHFKHDSVAAATVLHEGSRRPMSENDHYMFEQVAASWFEKGYTPAVAQRIVEDMARNARSSGFKKFLNVRAARLQMLIDLGQAAEQFAARKGRPPQALSELVDAGIIAAIPADPFGQGFELDESGKPIFRRPGGQKR